MAQDQEYIKSIELWIEGQKSLIEEMKGNRDYLMNDIEIKKRSIAIIDKTLIHENKQLEKQFENLKKYKTEA